MEEQGGVEVGGAAVLGLGVIAMLVVLVVVLVVTVAVMMAVLVKVIVLLGPIVVVAVVVVVVRSGSPGRQVGVDVRMIAARVAMDHDAVRRDDHGGGEDRRQHCGQAGRHPFPGYEARLDGGWVATVRCLRRSQAAYHGRQRRGNPAT